MSDTPSDDLISVQQAAMVATLNLALAHANDSVADLTRELTAANAKVSALETAAQSERKVSDCGDAFYKLTVAQRDQAWQRYLHYRIG